MGNNKEIHLNLSCFGQVQYFGSIIYQIVYKPMCRRTNPIFEPVQNHQINNKANRV